MSKFIIIALALICSFSCNRKVTTFEPKVTYELPCDTLDLGSIFSPIDTSDYLRFNKGITYDTSNITFGLSNWEPTYDTSRVVVFFMSDWETGKVDKIVGTIVYPKSRFGIWLDLYGKASDSKLYKVEHDMWIPLEWPKHITDLYIKPKK